MNRIPTALLTALAIGLLPGCSSNPPKVSCERHLSPINLTRSAAGAGKVAPGASGTGSNGSAPKASPHGR